MKPSTRFEIDWTSDESHILSANQKLEELHHNSVFSKPSFIWLKTSGTTSSAQKWIGLKKQAILASAKSVNSWIEVTQKDIWLNTLPLYHIGGLSILARSHLSGSQVFNHRLQPWNVLEFKKSLEETKATLISLVPTQVYDLVKANIKCPSHVRVVFVGGGALSSELYVQARKLHWPILPTYGMTELASQVATAELSSLNQQRPPKLTLLPHIEAKTNQEGLLLLKSSSQYSYKITNTNEGLKIDPSEEFILTQDKVLLEDNSLTFQQRQSDSLKISGYLVDKTALNNAFAELAEKSGMDSRKLVIQSLKNPRRDNDLVLFFEGYHFCEIQSLVQNFNTSLKNTEKIQRMYRVSELKRTELGKLKNQVEIISD